MIFVEMGDFLGDFAPSGAICSVQIWPFPPPAPGGGGMREGAHLAWHPCFVVEFRRVLARVRLDRLWFLVKV